MLQSIIATGLLVGHLTCLGGLVKVCDDKGCRCVQPNEDNTEIALKDQTFESFRGLKGNDFRGTGRLKSLLGRYTTTVDIWYTTPTGVSGFIAKGTSVNVTDTRMSSAGVREYFLSGYGVWTTGSTIAR
jgi:hypothetical protein